MPEFADAGGLDGRAVPVGTDKDRVVRLNLLKTLTNCAVLPASRMQLFANDALVVRLRRLAESSNDPLMKRHAEFALDAVKFQP
jgi:hypothetical protein